ncbi:MAG: GTPase Era [Syntrophobacterales bacterium]|nr:GTPase Era [Syntrophobacterales bacterium]
MFKSGFIAIVGRPNVGKSTLINSIVGEKVAIITPKPQTTRNRITGIKTTAEGQMIFIDTPGIHKAKTLLNRRLVDTARGALSDADVVLFVVSAEKEPGSDDEFILTTLRPVEVPVILVINKIDLVTREKLLSLIDDYRRRRDFREVVPISALKGFSVDRLERLVLDLLPEGPKYFPDDIFTDLPERFLAAEMIREKVILLTREEIPYVTAVTVDTFREVEEKNLIVIQATITVEKESQKGILIGKKGSMLKEIGTRAREELERFFNAAVYLELFVKVSPGWTRDTGRLREYGYAKD